MARTARFVSAVFVGILVGVPLTAIPRSAAGAADDCLTEAKQDTPSGQHWYYRIERGTGRHCWYLRGEADRPAQAASASPPSKARQADIVPSRSLEDAHAELLAPRPPIATSAATTAAPPKAAGPAATTSNLVATPSDANASRSQVGARWPDPSGVPSAVASPPALAEATADAEPAPEIAPSPPPVLVATPETTPATEVTSAKATGSLQKLLLAIVGALTLAGLSASIVFRLGHARQKAVALARRRNGAIWQSFDETHRPAPPPWTEPQHGLTTAPSTDYSLSHGCLTPADVRWAEEARYEEDRHANLGAEDRAEEEEEHYDNVADTEATEDTDDTDDTVEQIEDFLVRLTRQLQAGERSLSPR